MNPGQNERDEFCAGAKLKRFQVALFVFYVIFCGLNLHLWPANKFEWMLAHDPGSALPIDEKNSVYAAFAGAPILIGPWFIFRSNRPKLRLVAILSLLVLLIAWMIKFHSSPV